jgi:hypothetical protein
MYMVSSWISGTLQDSFEGYIGSVIYGVVNVVRPNFMAFGYFMAIVYALTFLMAVMMVWVGIAGQRDGGKK